MLTAQTVRQALKQEVQPQIYSRGLEYARANRVRNLSSEADEADNTVTVTGRVRGSSMYKTVLNFDIKNETFLELECTCPYGDACKHTVALGLVYADSLSLAHTNKPVIDVTAREISSSESTLRQALETAGLAAEAVPQDLIARLLSYRPADNNTQPQSIASYTPKKNNSSGTKNKPFNASDYFITLHSHNGYAPAFHKTNQPQEQANITTVLARTDITEAQRDLLTYIKNGRFDVYNVKPPDVAKLFTLLGATNFPIFKHSYAYQKQRLVIELKPKPLTAELIYEPRNYGDDKSRVRHDFFLRIPEEYWKNKDPRYDQAFFLQGNSLIRETDSALELHKLTPGLIDLFSRLEPAVDYEDSRRKIKYHQTRLTGTEVADLEQLAQDAQTLLQLSSPPPQLTARQSTLCKPGLEVAFDNDEQSIQVQPVMDYGFYQQDISESVYVSRKNGNARLERRESFEQPGTHIIAVKENIIHCAPVNDKKEIKFYRELAKVAVALGFTKTLKCQRRGAGQVTEYLRETWPKLAALAKARGYKVVFTKDKLEAEQATFRADFATDLNAENDWLYFDVACYCADERVTLEKLMEFIASGQTFWRKNDGTLVDIANRAELERLARLLKNFHARENGGFEGKLYHAPELEYVMTSSPHYNARRAESFKKFTADVQKGKPVKNIKLPKTLAATLRPYQKAGVDWLYFLRSYRFAGILADDMGLGKTIQALTLIAQEKINGRPSIVVCPKTLLYNWQAEAEQFFPGLRVLVIEGTPLERAEMRKKIKDYDLVVISYSTLKQDEKYFETKDMRFHYAVLDEAQFVKNHATKSAQIVKKIPADYRLALTGTPLENSVSELWSIFDFLMPGFLGNYEHFSKTFHKPIMDAGDRQALEHLRGKIQSFMLRRTKSEVLRELPPKIEQTSQCHLNPAQNILYQQVLVKIRGEVFQAVKQKGFSSAQIHILAGLTKLRQVCNHPALLLKTKNWREHQSAKLEMCMELVREFALSKRKALIFSQFTSMLDIVAEALREQNIPYAYLSGKTKNRQDVINKFSNDPNVSVFLISMKAGGTGLNLTAADAVIVFDPWWNPSVENQAVDRAHRIGQKKTVNVYRLLTIGTIEEKIQALKGKKQNLFNAVVGESRDLFKKLTWDDVRELFAE